MRMTDLKNAGLFFGMLACGVFGECITDTSGYVTLKEKDAAGQTSFNTKLHWSEPSAPHGGADYLIQGGREMRTPDNVGSVTFAGKSLTLDYGAISIKSYNGATITIPDFRIYPNSKIAVGNNNGSFSLAGKMTVMTTAAGPLNFWCGDTCPDARTITVKATISGDVNSVIKKTTFAKLEFSGDNSEYLGRFVTENHTGIGGWKDLVGTHKHAFGPWNVERSEPLISLSNDCRLYMHPETPVNGVYAKIATGANPVIGTSAAAGDKFLTFGGGATINGSGTLTLDAGKAGVMLDDVTLGEGFTGISFVKGKAALGGNFALALPVTLREGASLAPNGSQTGVMKMSSLTLTDAAVTYHCTTAKNADGTLSYDQVIVDGDLAIPADGCKINVMLSDEVLFTEIAGMKLKLFSAANLGAEGGLGAGDFSVSADSEFAQDFDGTVAIETIDGKKWVTFTKTSGPVYVRHIATGDASGGTMCCFYNGAMWMDGGNSPSSGKDYYSDVLLRVPENKSLNTVFQGDSLAMAAGSQLNLKVTDSNLTISNLVLGSGAKIVTAGGFDDTPDNVLHHLHGTAVAVASKSNPSRFCTTIGRNMEISSVFRGSGALRFDFIGNESQANNQPAKFHFTSESPLFTGSVMCTGHHTLVYDSELCIGGPSADGTTVRTDNFVLQSNAVFSVERSFNLTDVTRGMTMDGTGNMGGVFNVLDGVTMTNSCPIAGNGYLRKTGGGTLVLNGVNTLSNEIDLREGTLGAGHRTAFGTASLKYRGAPSLLIESADGVAVKSITSADDSELTVIPVALLNRNGYGSVSSDIFRLPKGTVFDLDSVSVSKDGLNGWTVELSMRENGEELVVSAKATVRGFAIIIR